MTDAATALLDCRGIEKSFAAVKALRGVDFSVRPGRVHGLVGENGAGKSTLTKVLAGLYPPDAGTIALDGQPLSLRGTDDALTRGIVTVHQDINLIPTQTVAENIFLANEPTMGLLGVVRMGAMRAQAHELLARHGIAVSPDSRVAELANDQRKMVQIVKAISRRARVLLLDEPTSSLTEDEVRLVQHLAERCQALAVAPGSLAAGRFVTPASKSSTPASAAIAAAVSGLSPVIIMVRIPIRRS